MITMENAGEGQGGNNAAEPKKKEPQTKTPKETPKEPQGIFSEKELPKDSKIAKSETSTSGIPGMKGAKKDLTVTTSEKLAFIDSVVNNTRFELSYSLFGGKITLTVRSLTSEELQALSVWTIKQSTENPADQMSGRFRKYLMAAQISRYNGVDMPPLEHPLFETLEKDGKTVKKPGWIERGAFWDDMGAGVSAAIIGCLSDFDLKYGTMCSKAEDENFWDPDTP